MNEISVNSTDFVYIYKPCCDVSCSFLSFLALFLALFTGLGALATCPWALIPRLLGFSDTVPRAVVLQTGRKDGRKCFI